MPTGKRPISLYFNRQLIVQPQRFNGRPPNRRHAHDPNLPATLLKLGFFLLTWYLKRH